MLRFRPESLYIAQTMQDNAIVTIEGEYKTVAKLSNDLERPVTLISRSRYYLTSNNSKMAPDRAIITMADQ